MCFSLCCYKQLGDCMQVLRASVSPLLKLHRTECACLGGTQQPLDFSLALCRWPVPVGHMSRWLLGAGTPAG